MPLSRSTLAIAVLLAVFLHAPALLAAEDAEHVLVIRDHKFEPDVLEVPAGKVIMLRVKNMDASPEEFESHELDREKVIPGGGEVVIRIGPLDPGTYPFFGEFHEDSAKGKLVVK